MPFVFKVTLCRQDFSTSIEMTLNQVRCVCSEQFHLVFLFCSMLEPGRIQLNACPVKAKAIANADKPLFDDGSIDSRAAHA